MFLKNLHLTQYKNFVQQSFEFDAKINCLVGNNGVGKTNVLDAIYHLSQTKSYFNPISLQNINHTADFFIIEGNFFADDQSETQLVCSFKTGQKKTLKRNGKFYEKFSEHIGFIPVVIISPIDTNLITESSETRRKFMDHVIAQSDKQYLNYLLSYHKVLTQRNALLKYFFKNRTFDATHLSVFDEQLSEYGQLIFEKRKQFVSALTPFFQEHYQQISEGAEQVSLGYSSSLVNTPLLESLQENIPKDRMLQYTSVGIHRDDLEFLINEYSVQKFGSQGQQKSFLIALKLAQFDLIKKQSTKQPILLLDDIFDKLDDHRVARLVNLVKKEHFGQLFISDTHRERTENIVKQTGQTYKIINL